MPEIIDQIHKLILEECWISAKPTAEKLGISHEQVGSIIHEHLNMWKLSAKWVLKYLNTDQNVNSASHLSNFWNLFVWRHPNDFLSCLVTMDETYLSL
jgi:hypothetical protein